MRCGSVLPFSPSMHSACRVFSFFCFLFLLFPLRRTSWSEYSDKELLLAFCSFFPKSSNKINAVFLPPPLIIVCLNYNIHDLFNAARPCLAAAQPPFFFLQNDAPFFLHLGLSRKANRHQYSLCGITSCATSFKPHPLSFSPEKGCVRDVFFFPPLSFSSSHVGSS